MKKNWMRCVVRAAGLLAAGTLLTATKLCETGRLSNLSYALLAALCLLCLGLLVQRRVRSPRSRQDNGRNIAMKKCCKCKSLAAFGLSRPAKEE